ncbi:MAG: carboxymuconolactone decarboxylase family protein [Polyangiaceae bacterium]
MNKLLTGAIGVVVGGRAPNIFTTLARHRRLFRRWLVFAGGLMPGGAIPRRETELVILYVARRMGSEYEWNHHERLGKRVGVSSNELEQVRSGTIVADCFSAREQALLLAACELLDQADISDATYARLLERVSDREIIELCLLVGHYQMLAMTLKALRVAPD